MDKTEAQARADELDEWIRQAYSPLNEWPEDVHLFAAEMAARADRLRAAS